MSKQVDERIVSMQFDNKNFESNVSTTMSTIDKLKAKLGFQGATKGLENVNSAAKNVNMSGLSNGVAEVQAKFSALEVASITAISNITNKIVDAGIRWAKSLTIEPVMDGFQEYEMTLNAVQTTMAGTGKTAEEVEEQLKRLDEYADKTVYGTADMLNNLPKFTNAGVELEKATTAMIGIANATALAGGDAGKASIAFYNLGQAIGTGYLSRMDYNSINNAGIATMEWKNQMIDAAIAAGTLTKAGEDAYKAGGKTFTLQQLFIDGLQTQWATTDVMMKVFEDYGNEQTKIGAQAYSAAQDIKTFTQMMESLKATAGTGWKDTWQLIFGGLDQAKEFWTGITNFISGVLGKMSYVRNRVLQIALDFGKPWADMKKKLDAFLEPVEKITGAIEDLDDVVQRVIRGEFGNGVPRYEDLAEAGYNYYLVQNKVNEALNCSFRYSQEEIDAEYELMGVKKKTTESTSKQSAALEELTDEQLKNAGFTEEEIRLYRALEKEAARTGTTIGELADKMSTTSGRTLLIDAFKNLGDIVVGTAKAVKEAYVQIFNPPSVEELGIRLYGIIESFKKFTDSLRLTDEETGKLNANGLKMQRTLKGIFAAIDIVLTIVGGPLKIVFKIITQLLGMFNLNILDVTAVIGDAIVGFNNWLDSVLDFTGVFKFIEPYVKKAVNAIKNFKDSLNISGTFQNFVNWVKSGFAAFKEWIAGAKDAENLPKYIADGISKGFSAVIKFVTGGIANLKNNLVNGFSGIGSGSASSFVSKLKDGILVAVEVVAILGKRIVDSIKEKLKSGFIRAGMDTIAGFVKGIGDNVGPAVQGIWNFALEIIRKFCEVLGIHSPSTVFIEIGKNIIMGLYNGITGAVSMVYELLMTVGNKCIEIIKNLDIGSVLASVTTGGMVYSLVKIADGFEALTDPIGEFGEFIESLGRSVNRLSKAASTKLRADAFKSIAIAIGILVAAIVVLTFLDPAKVWMAVGVVAVVGVLLTGLMVLVGKFGPKESLQLGKLSVALIGIGAAILLIAWAMKSLSGIDPDKWLATIGGLSAIVISLMGIIASYGLFVKGQSAKNINKAASMIFKIGVTMLLLVAVVKLASTLTSDGLIKAGLVAAGLLVFVLALSKMTMVAGKNMDKAGAMIFKISIAMLLLTFVIKIIGGLDPKTLITGLLTVAALAGIIVGLIAATKLAGKDLNKIASTMIGIGVAIGIMGIVMKMLSGLNPYELTIGIVAVAALAAIIAGLIYATKFAGKDLARIGSTLLMMSVAIGILAIVAVVLGMISLPNLAKGVIAVSILASMMALMIYATKDAKNCKGNIMAMAIAIGVMAVAVAVLSFIDPKKLAGATVAMGILMGVFTLMIKASMQAKKAKKAIGPLIILTAAIAVIAGVIYLLSTLDTGAALSSSVALSALLLSMSAALLILSHVGKSAMNALAGVLLLTTMAGPMLVFIGVLAVMNSVPQAASNAKVLIALMATMTLLMIPLTIVGSFAVSALIGVGALLAMSVPMLAFIGILALMNGVKNATKNANLLITMMTALTSILVVLAIIGPLALIGVAAMTGLTALMVAIGALAVGIGALMENFPALRTFLDTGIDVLIQLAGGIGEMIGAFVSGIATQIASSLPMLGMCLSQFMINAMPFIVGVKMVDWSVLEGVGILAACVLALTAVDLIEGVASFLQGGSSFSSLGTELSKFMENAKPFIEAAKNVNAKAMEGVKAIAQAVLILTAADVLDGLTSWLTGGSSLSEFGAQLPDLGKYIRDFVDKLGAFDESSITTVDCAGRAIKALAESAKTLPNDGGWLGAILGENSLASFGEQLPMLGYNLTRFITNLGTFDENTVTTVDCAGRAIKALAEAADAIPNTGGLWAKIVGDNSLASFGEDLPKLAYNLTRFIVNLGTFDESTVATVDCAGKAIKALADSANTIPNTEGLWQRIFGEKSLAKFGGDLPGLGTNLSDFVTNLGTFDEGKIATVNCACGAITALADAAKAANESGSWWDKLLGDSGLSKFSGDLPDLGTHLKDFATNIGTINVDSVNSATSAITALSKLTTSGLNSDTIDDLGDFLEEIGGDIKEYAEDMAEIDVKSLNTTKSVITALTDHVNRMAQIDTAAVDNFKAVMVELATTYIDTFIGKMTSETTQTSLEDAAKKVVGHFVAGMTAVRTVGTVHQAAETLINGAIAKIRSPEVAESFGSAGAYVVDGFVAGIDNSSYKAALAAKAMADAAKEAAEEALNEHSPSKEFYRIGAFAGMGLVNALADYESKAGRAGGSLAKSSLDGLRSTMTKLSRMFETDVDIQPTISPVVDLDNVRAGASAISSMLSGRRSLAIDTSSIGAVSALMNQRQNGEGTVVSAINKLRKDLGSFAGNTYNINGISYEEGSDVGEALKVITRAAIKERRV